MEAELSLDVRGREARLELRALGAREAVASGAWGDRRNLADQFFRRADRLLEKAGLRRRDVKHMAFSCDSPYWGRPEGSPLLLEELDSTGRCGFTAWQTGEIIAKVVDFSRE